MKKVLVILGNITFEDDKAIVHQVDDIIHVEEDKAEEAGESLVNLYDGYLVPALFKGTIEWDEGVKMWYNTNIVLQAKATKPKNIKK